MLRARSGGRKILRPTEVASFLGISKPTFYRILHSDPNFPKKIQISTRCVGWFNEEIEAWLEKQRSK